MRNLDFLARILSSNNTYWIVAKRNDSTTGRMKDSIILLALPPKIDINIERNEIKLTDIEALVSYNMDMNIFLNEPYPPFQLGQNLYNVYDGFAIDGLNIKDVMIKALSIKSDSLYEYKEKLKDLLEPTITAN